MSFHTQNRPTLRFGVLSENRTQNRTKSSSSVAVHVSSVLQTNGKSGKGNLPDQSKKGMALKKCQVPNFVLSQPNTVGIIGGVSVFSSLLFLEKLVWWSLKDGGECPPFVVCSDPTQYKELPIRSLFQSLKRKAAEIKCSSNNWAIVESLCRKRAFLENSGARCIVMPCHLSHAWHDQISEDCSLNFLHVGECVARELREAKMKPLETGSNVRIGVLATDATLMAGFYQEKLQSQVYNSSSILLLLPSYTLLTKSHVFRV
jgi:aspartate/glutamate racemase